MDHQIFDRKLSMSSIKYQNACLGKAKFSNEDHDWFYRNVLQITLIVIKEDTFQMALEYLRNPLDFLSLFLSKRRIKDAKIVPNFMFGWERLQPETWHGDKIIQLVVKVLKSLT